MLTAWVVYYMTISIAALMGIALAFVAWDIYHYVTQGWKRYALTDQEWNRLQLHLQTRAYQDRETY